ncbi:class I SAM-dependent methyltransferase [Acinetobacter sp.]|uniref:class I SAM-dependent methyltransferase n=1 Tax=Acinetobacter sp. TaxID=472 RepID=UPI002826C1EC|nr:class I SAM-dependent methyltransferase [Acinetobacter sp.]MDR2249737.1 class I SAM-dependent methyltransferase [Acinetobacter sp.]
MDVLNFKDHFSNNSDRYAAYRPSYPIDLVDELAHFCPAQQRVLDCGCGTGQLSVLLAERFDEVIATDASATQIEKAKMREGVIYRTALAEESGLADGTVDLITVAQAAHWLDLDKFYQEVNRVARPNAIIALITYGVLHVEGAVDTLIQQFYYKTIGQYWPEERKHVEDGYRNLPFPFLAVKIPSVNMEAFWSLDELMGYFNTWSAVKEAQKILGHNPVEQFREELLPEWGNPETKKKITWPLSIRAGRVHPKEQS